MQVHVENHTAQLTRHLPKDALAFTGSRELACIEYTVSPSDHYQPIEASLLNTHHASDLS
jgi:hypothetical protein